MKEVTCFKSELNQDAGAVNPTPSRISIFRESYILKNGCFSMQFRNSLEFPRNFTVSMISVDSRYC